MKVLNERRSSRDAEVIYRIIENDSGELICNCPACEHGDGCWEIKKILANREYQKLLSIKHSISDTKIPDKRRLQMEQVAYIDRREGEWKKYSELLSKLEKIMPLETAIVIAQQESRYFDFRRTA